MWINSASGSFKKSPLELACNNFSQMIYLISFLCHLCDHEFVYVLPGIKYLANKFSFGEFILILILLLFYSNNFSRILRNKRCGKFVTQELCKIAFKSHDFAPLIFILRAGRTSIALQNFSVNVMCPITLHTCDKHSELTFAKWQCRTG